MIKNTLKFIAKLQSKYPLIFLSVILLLTTIIAFGVPSLQVQSDFSKENPRQLPAYVLTDRISDEFGGENTVVLVFEVSDNDENKLIDLREPQFITFLQELEASLKQDSRVIKTSSMGTIMSSYPPESRDDILNFMNIVPETKSLFSDDYRMTILTMTTNIGGAYEDIVPFEEMLENKIASVDFPGGVDYILTGGPSFGKTIRETVFSDTTKTMTFATIGILLLLLLTERSFKKAFLIFMPLIFALVWAAGILGFSGLQLSIASVALGSIILGLGVEYGVFMLTRYNEERFTNKMSQIDANQETVSSIGVALLSSGITTVAGFLALTFSFTPMMQNLGLSLGIGISACILSAIFVAPLLIIIEENIEKYFLDKNLDKKIEKRRFFNN